MLFLDLLTEWQSFFLLLTISLVRNWKCTRSFNHFLFFFRKSPAWPLFLQRSYSPVQISANSVVLGLVCFVFPNGLESKTLFNCEFRSYEYWEILNKLMAISYDTHAEVRTDSVCSFSLQNVYLLIHTQVNNLLQYLAPFLQNFCQASVFFILKA